jgi:hypothetical protein
VWDESFAYENGSSALHGVVFYLPPFLVHSCPLKNDLRFRVWHSVAGTNDFFHSAMRGRGRCDVRRIDDVSGPRWRCFESAPVTVESALNAFEEQ